MDSTSSVSKGVFVFKNNFQALQSKPAKKKKHQKDESFQNIYALELWYQSYKNLWNSLERKIKKLNSNMFSKIQNDLLLFVNDCYKQYVTEIPIAVILMGINMPDHHAQFSTLSDEIEDCISTHVATLHAEDCSSIKLLVENMVSQFVNDEDSDDSTSESGVIKKTLCTISLLCSWYNEKYTATKPDRKTVSRQKHDVVRKNLVVIMPEFESFDEAVLRDFLLIVSSYLNELPFVIIFGVATSLATIHKTLPYQVTSKMKIQVFSSQQSTEYLNSILNNVLLSGSCPFHLGGKTFTLFTDIFLFYDFSVKGFVQNFKFAMLEHYSYGNAISLCTNRENIDEILSNFVHSDFENVRSLPSFEKLIENSKDNLQKSRLKEDDKYFKRILKDCLIDFHDFVYRFHVLLQCLHEFVFELPDAPLGKQFREVYAHAVTENVVKTEEYKKCIKLLNILSKDQLIDKLSKICDILKLNIVDQSDDILEEAFSIVDNFLNELNNCNHQNMEETEEEPEVVSKIMSRSKLREEVLKMSKDKKNYSKYEKTRETNLKALSEFFSKHLILPTSKPFYEIFFFNKTNSIKNHVIGSHRAAIHSSLDNPHSYLKCKCCELPNEVTILPSMPDISIVYKLHLECGKFINLYDWLQAFASVVDPADGDEEERTIDPKLQARFARTVAELEFLGFIKTSKKKIDHVQRLTWGGC